MGGGERSMLLYKDLLPFAAMVMVECTVVGGHTLYKSATAKGLNSYVFTFYVFLMGFFFILPLPFVVHRRTGIPPIELSIVVQIFFLGLIMYLSQMLGYFGIKYSSPTLSSIMGNLSPAFTFIIAFIFRMEKVKFQSFRSQAKIVGTLVSVAGALIATLYNGPSLLSNSMSMNWIIGGILLASQNLVQSFAMVAQAKILIMYPVVVVVMLMFSVSGVVAAGLGALVMATDLDDWKLQPGIVLTALLYMGVSTGFLNVSVIIWTLGVKGPVYVAMFKPLTIVIAVIMGLLFLGDTLHLGSVVGGIIITIGFYGVLWGKAKEEGAPSTQATAPLLEPYDALEQGSSTIINESKYVS